MMLKTLWRRGNEASVTPPPTDLPAMRLIEGQRASHAVVHIVQERCAGCQECIIRCPTGALSMDIANWVAESNDALCVGCRQCERVCPYSCIEVQGPMVVGPRKAAYPQHVEPLQGSTVETRSGFGSWQEALIEADRCLNCPDPTCMEGCPAHNDIPGFIAAIQEHDLASAHAILRETSIMPDICSRVCDQGAQCEGACSWALAGGEPVAIGRLERFVGDQQPVPGVERGSITGSGLSVAVVGSGPAGCAAAWELLSAGVSVTMIEKDAEPGGVLRWGIPAFTLPEALAQRPMLALIEAGMTLRTDCALGRDVSLEELRNQHDAVILAHGAGRPLTLPIKGTELPGVEEAHAVLERGRRALREGVPLEDIGPGKKVLVLGGGNTAMDVARTVRRFGAAVTAVEWMDQRFVRVRPDELAEARAEGVEIRFTTTVERLEGDPEGVRTAWLRRTRQVAANKLPEPLPEAAEAFAVDKVIFALGYRVDVTVTAGEIDLPLPRVDQRNQVLDRRWIASGILAGVRPGAGTLALNREVGLAVASSPVNTGWWSQFRGSRTRQSAAAGRTAWIWRWRRHAAAGLDAATAPRAMQVWVAGDALVGPSTVVSAMAQGKAAAKAVLAVHPQQVGRTV